MRILLVALLAGCGGVQEPKVGWQPLTGTEYLTPKKGLSFWWQGPGGAYATPEAASQAIDDAYTEWVAIDQAKFGGNLSPIARLTAIQRVDIQLFTGSAVVGNDTDLSTNTISIYWPWQYQIDAAMDAQPHEDKGLGVWSVGLQCLRHEWSHVLHGAYHP